MDRVHMLAYFLYAQRRLPRRNSGLLNDYMFFLKADGELDDPLRGVTTDKVHAKYFIDGMAGARVTPRTLAVFDSVDEIRRATLAEPCVLKPAHASGNVAFLEDVGTGLSEADYRTLERALAYDVYRETREINYRYLRKRIICEELIEPADTIKDYKMFCYHGAVRFTQVDSDRHGVHKQNFYDGDWNRIEVSYNDNPTGEWEERPACYARMREIAERIARHFDWVRVDFYLRGDEIFVGEITHCHNQANGVFGSLEQERAISRVFFGQAR